MIVTICKVAISLLNFQPLKTSLIIGGGGDLSSASNQDLTILPAYIHKQIMLSACHVILLQELS